LDGAIARILKQARVGFCGSRDYRGDGRGREVESHQGVFIFVASSKPPSVAAHERNATSRRQRERRAGYANVEFPNLVSAHEASRLGLLESLPLDRNYFVDLRPCSGAQVSVVAIAPEAGIIRSLVAFDPGKPFNPDFSYDLELKDRLRHRRSSSGSLR
jgi:hypothetical protein